MTDRNGHDLSEHIVAFNNVQKSYDGETIVVRDLNLHVQRGEFLTMLGPSGSGKTTVLMMLAGFESLTGGEILLNGAPIHTVPPHKRGLGMVFQSYALFPHMTVGENLAFPLRARRLDAASIRDKVRNALAMVRLEDFEDRRPKQISGGQQQRVAVARALVFEPEMVLMDEPLCALDRNLREEMQYEIKDLHERLGVSVIYVTHDQTEALTMSNRVAVFNNGVIQQLAEPDILYDSPSNAFVAGFIGESNALEGRVRSVDGQVCTVETPGALVRALPVDVKKEAGAPVRLSVRPERITLNPPQDAALDNVLSGRVTAMIYLGDQLRVHVAALEKGELIVKVPNAYGLGRVKKGDQVTLGWRAQDCRAFAC